MTDLADAHRSYRDELLRHGAPPLRVLRETMLKDPQQWPKTL